MTTAKVEAVAWCDEAQDFLSKIDKNYNVLDIKKQVEGGAVLYRVHDAVGTICYYVLTIYEKESHDEGVIFAAAGNRAGVDITAVMIPYIENQLKSAGCRFLRIHTARRGLIKKLYQLGFEFQEMVIRKELSYA